MWDWHQSSLGCFLALALTGSIVDAIKICVGRPRPDLIDRCQPQSGSADAPIFGLSNHGICTRTDLLKDGFRSFPSGHSAFSFAGLGFLSFYLSGKLHLFDRRGYTGKAWIALGPLLGAALVAVSRTMDNRHHWHDVTVGSILGITVAFFCYRQYYPPLSSRLSHEPYAPRLHSENKQALPIHNRDDSYDAEPRYHVSALEPHMDESRVREDPFEDGPQRRERI
ncbi:hypothetical protein FRB94_011542 [Tulasnella sp. JGI-2019a]|nr:hypothetical protein FRB94_011542 [Tulasnella sp. JGI-2019a]